MRWRLGTGKARCDFLRRNQRGDFETLVQKLINDRWLGYVRYEACVVGTYFTNNLYGIQKKTECEGRKLLMMSEKKTGKDARRQEVTKSDWN